MNTHDFRTMNKAELAARIDVLQAGYHALRDQVRSGKAKNNQQLRAARKDIARARTILQES